MCVCVVLISWGGDGDTYSYLPVIFRDRGIVEGGEFLEIDLVSSGKPPVSKGSSLCLFHADMGTVEGAP